MVKFTEESFNTQKQILVFPDSYVAFAAKLSKNSVLATTTDDGKKIVKAGTFYPANDDTAVGIVLNDYDVTAGDQMAAILTMGFVKTAALPEAPTPECENALRMIQFFPRRTTILELGASSIKAGETGGEVYVTVAGTRFKPTIDKSKVTLTAGTTGVAVGSVELLNGNRTLKVILTGKASAGQFAISIPASEFVNGHAPAALVVTVTGEKSSAADGVEIANFNPKKVTFKEKSVDLNNKLTLHDIGGGYYQVTGTLGKVEVPTEYGYPEGTDTLFGFTVKAALEDGGLIVCTSNRGRYVELKKAQQDREGEFDFIVNGDVEEVIISVKKDTGVEPYVIHIKNTATKK